MPRRSCDFGNKLVFREGFPIVTYVQRAVWLLVACGVALIVLAALPVDAQTAAQATKDPAYRAFPVFGSRLAVWAVAQLHLNFAAFILGVPIFAVIIEAMGWRTGEARYDWLSHELVKLTFAAFSTTAMLGALLLFLFVGYYPRFWAYLTSIFFPTYWVYALLFFGDTFILYLWYYVLEWLSGSRKCVHVILGGVADLVGTAIVAVSAFIVLPFAGYWLGREIYAFNQTMGITMMGGFMSWLWIVQAILIGILFLGSNYYLWLGMERIPGSERYRKFVPPMLLILTIGFMIWATPRTMVITFDEARAMGGTHHPVLGFFGVMSAKNTVVNLMILTTFLSFVLYRRANRVSTKSWTGTGMMVQWAAIFAAAIVVVFYGVYGYFVEWIIRIGFSVYQVEAVLGCIVLVMALDIPMFKGARSTGTIRWGTIAPRSQYVLILLAVTFTWLMGLMGFARSGIRQHWHVYGV